MPTFTSAEDSSSSFRTKQKQQNVQEYGLWDPSEIKDSLQKWADHYSEFARVTTAQDAYNLPTAGDKQDCPFDEQVRGCLNYILVLQDFVQYPENSKSEKRLPQVLWSGEVHGNERVGPTAVMEAAYLLLWAAECESHPRLQPSNTNNNTTSAIWQKELARAAACRQNLRDFGIDDVHRQWLARLLSTRRIVVVPTANALGYYRSERGEEGIDPNRDFPYEVTDPQACMQIIAGRTLNEIFRQHMFQLSLNFMVGMK